MTKAKFIAFEKVCRSGLTNMYDINEVRFIAVLKFGQELTKKDGLTFCSHLLSFIKA